MAVCGVRGVWRGGLYARGSVGRVCGFLVAVGAGVGASVVHRVVSVLLSGCYWVYVRRFGVWVHGVGGS